MASKHPIATRENAVIGARLVFPDCRVHFISSYTVPEAERNRAYKTDVVWRHVFQYEKGMMVYTGKNLHLRRGQIVTLCGTVKRFEHWGDREQLRLSVVKIIEKPAQILMDF